MHPPASQSLPDHPGVAPISKCSAFSLIEVSLAIGIVGFAFVTLLGLVPTGLMTVDNGYAQARAIEVLKSASSAVVGQRFIGTVSGNRTFAFGDWLSDAANPQNDPTKYFVTQPEWSITDFNVTEGGVIRKQTDTSTAVWHKLLLRVTPPADDTQPVKVYLSVAWPGTATWSTVEGKWKGQNGFVETVVYANLPN